MLVSDFILQTRAELQEKREFWKDPELLIKLQRAYVSLQFDMPYFMTSENIVIQEGKDMCYLKHKPLRGVLLRIQSQNYDFVDDENLYLETTKKVYSFVNTELLLPSVVRKKTKGFIRYKYEKTLKTDKCEIEIPLNWYKALRLLFMSEIHEKPTRNTKERNLSDYYLKRYSQEITRLRHHKTARAKNITANFQRI